MFYIRISQHQLTSYICLRLIYIPRLCIVLDNEYEQSNSKTYTNLGQLWQSHQTEGDIKNPKNPYIP